MLKEHLCLTDRHRSEILTEPHRLQPLLPHHHRWGLPRQGYLPQTLTKLEEAGRRQVGCSHLEDTKKAGILEVKKLKDLLYQVQYDENCNVDL